jgi:hypothetical protein
VCFCFNETKRGLVIIIGEKRKIYNEQFNVSDVGDGQDLLRGDEGRHVRGEEQEVGYLRQRRRRARPGPLLPHHQHPDTEDAETSNVAELKADQVPVSQTQFYYNCSKKLFRFAKENIFLLESKTS